MNDQPLISVLLPVYNAENYIRASIESILNQTYSNFELIILNDGSTDGSEAIIKEFKDKRIHYVFHQNRGLAKTLNVGIKLSNGSIFARQDADDISLPNRFEEQIHFLNEHPTVMLLGTGAQIIDEKGNLQQAFHNHPTLSAELKTDLLFNNPFVHSSVMIRKEVLNLSGNYTADIFEDYTLWSAIAETSEIRNLADCLVHYRQVQSGISQTTSDYKKVVFNQSFHNCLPYVEKEQEEDLKNLLRIHHSYYKWMTAHPSFHQLKSLLKQLLLDFSKKKNLDPAEMNIDKQLTFFKRSYYSYKIDSGIFPVPIKLFYKIKRKLYLRKLQS
jgi:glycosyltransferase involved in cell wall biosynthesis